MDRRFYVTVDRTYDSQIKKCAAGVPQGSCLSPALYGVHTDDIPCIQEPNLPYPRGVALALFADDSAFFATSSSPAHAAKKLQKTLDALPGWLDRWRMSVNASKTVALAVTRRRQVIPTLQLRGREVEWRTQVKYLGVTLDRSLSMGPQVNNAVNASRSARAQLRPVLGSDMPLRSKIRVYNTYIRSRLTYAIPSWWAYCSATSRKRIQAQQNIAMRTIVKAGRYVSNHTIYKDTLQPTVDEFATQMARRMFDRADNGPHNHLRGIAPLHARPPDNPTPAWRPSPRDILTQRPESPSTEEDEAGSQ